MGRGGRGHRLTVLTSGGDSPGWEGVGQWQASAEAALLAVVGSLGEGVGRGGAGDVGSGARLFIVVVRWYPG
jgi:hypothetical protein